MRVSKYKSMSNEVVLLTAKSSMQTQPGYDVMQQETGHCCCMLKTHQIFLCQKHSAHQMSAAGQFIRVLHEYQGMDEQHAYLLLIQQMIAHSTAQLHLSHMQL